MPHHTDMAKVLGVVGGFSKGCFWQVSEPETNYWPDPRFKEDVFIISDQELRTVLGAHDVQFDWAVFSALPVRPIRPQPVADRPYAAGNGAIWQDQPVVQHPSALFEVICWDSTATMVVSNIDGPVEAFMQVFSDAVPMRVHNLRGKSATL